MIERYRSVWSIVFLLFGSLLASLARDAGPADESTYKLASTKTLLFSPINDWWLADTIERWADSGFGGFIITGYVQWFTPAAELEDHRPHIAKIAHEGAKYGITDNFVNVQLAATEFDTGRALPAWQNEAEWSEVLSKNFATIAQFARTTGMKGVVLDTEPYVAHLWKVSDPRHGSLSKEALQRLVYDKGKRLMATLQAAFPGIQIILLQEGAFWWNVQGDVNYELWPAFYNGMASTRPMPGIVVGTESTYPEDPLLKALDRDPSGFITQRSAQIHAAMSSVVEHADYWRLAGSLAVGMRPLGATVADKSARYSIPVFQAQMEAARAASAKYVWVYSHGCAWWQMTQAEVDSYSNNPWHYTFDKPAQIRPADSRLQAFFDVIRKPAGANRNVK